MLEEITKFINERKNGMFLLDSPTGFGKTTAVINYLAKFLLGKICVDKKSMFFITNLKINLPWNDLREKVGDEVFFNNCLVLESYSDTVIRQWDSVKEIRLKLIKSSDEYITLNDDIYQFKAIEKELKNSDISPEDRKRKNTLKKIIENRIQEKSEPQFREFIKSNFFYGKSIVEKKKFIRDNTWFQELYPSSILEKYKVVFLTTSKFFLPIDTFHRMPFLLADDYLLDKSVVFIDEFDATKDVALTKIIEEDMKIQLDLMKLFLNIYYSIDNLNLPKRMLKTSEFLNKSINEGKDYKTPIELINGIKNEFKIKYDKYHFSFSIKSDGMDKNRTFLFYDGKSFTIVKDNSKKNIFAKTDEDNNLIRLYEDSNKFCSGTQLKHLIGDLNYSINYFIKGLVYLAENFKNLKNQSLEKNDTMYTIEESIMSIISVFNISDEFSKIIFQRAIEFYEGRVLEYEIELEEDSFMRKGFNFTEIEDDRYHDLQSKFHAYYFHTTPKDILLKKKKKANIIGISATASIETVIGNYDIKYLKKHLGEDFYSLSEDGKNRIYSKFNNQLEVYDKEDINIHVIPIDDIPLFSVREKTEYIIKNSLGLKEESIQYLLGKYYEFLSEKNGTLVSTKMYYEFIKFKIAKCYKMFCENEKMKSFLCFNNFSIKHNSKINEKMIKELFEIIANDNEFQYITPSFVNAENFVQEFENAKNKLKDGNKIFWISTYKTIGSGKNIQYPIPEAVIDDVVLDINDDRKDKDFDAIYLCTPTNLVQYLSFDTDKRYEDLAKYLFQQEYLRQNGLLSYQSMKQNIIRGFKKIFYNVEDIYYASNGDVLLHSAQIFIQAVCRICRCRNKNKNIYIFTDVDVLYRLQKIKNIFSDKIYNKEFLALLETNMFNKELLLKDYSDQNRRSSNDIKMKSWTVRRSLEDVRQWKYIRDYVLKYPTSNYISDDMKDYYFKFDEEYSGYSYSKGRSNNLKSLSLVNYIDENQVSDGDCSLAVLLDVPGVRDLFEKNKYATKFLRGQYIMSPSLYKQVYLGALGEVVGKIIIEDQLGLDLQDILDYTKYELFDFQIDNVYFDFKHWNDYVVDNDKYCNKIRKKLNRVNGEKCFIINITCNNKTDYICQNINNEIFVIPFLIDPETSEISKENINFILENMYD